MKPLKKRQAEFSDINNKKLSLFDKAADSIASWSGSWSFLTLHIIWFTLWLWLRIDINMLTMIVSLEAIILMTVLLMAQNRQAERDDIRDEADYQADVRSEKEIMELKKIVTEIRDNLKSDNKRK
ncbi:MAG: DUF1003 domain-containing protein [Candidatus Komeilibacteria bacterium]